MISSDSEDQPIKCEKLVANRNHGRDVLSDETSSDSFEDPRVNQSRVSQKKPLPSSDSESEIPSTIDKNNANLTAKSLGLDSNESDDSDDLNLTQKDVFGSDTGTYYIDASYNHLFNL